jgi:serine/threonine-protein kinase
MKLIFQDGPLAGQRFQVETCITIGRGAATSIAIADPSVSLMHCEIEPLPEGRWVTRDLGSTNGTYLNGERIVTGELKHGDILSIGKSRAEVHLPASRAPAVKSGFAGEPAPPQPAAQAGADSPRPDVSGNIFGQVSYFLKRKIATGGMGAIYEAEQFGAEGFVKKVALKTILPDLARNESFISSFVGEAKLVANLVHQNIVQIHHLGRHGDTYFIAMEYIDGIDLARFMELHRKLGRVTPVDMATFIVSRICRGLEYAHSKKDDQGNPLGLVHRDVSPTNIMITHEGEVKLTDFGVARARRFMEDDGENLVGCLEYMSPEQAACKVVDGRSDLFSLGLVYYELLTGVRVFRQQGDDMDDALARIRKCDIPDPRTCRPDLPDSVADTLMRCLARNRDDRPQTAGHLAYALESDMYATGYGPTIVALSRYVGDLLSAAGSGGV